MKPEARYALVEQLRRVEAELARLYHNYDERLKRLEARLRQSYDPLLERAADNTAGILRVLSAALRLARNLESALNVQDARVLRVRVSSLEDEAEKLRDQVYYGPVRLPSAIKIYVLTLVSLVRRLVEVLEAEGKPV